MKQLKNFWHCYMLFSLLPLFSEAQQLKITDFVVFGGNGSCPTGPNQKAPLYPGCGVLIGKSVNIKSGSICFVFSPKPCNNSITKV